MLVEIEVESKIKNLLIPKWFSLKEKKKTLSVGQIGSLAWEYCIIIYNKHIHSTTTTTKNLKKDNKFEKEEDVSRYTTIKQRE